LNSSSTVWRREVRKIVRRITWLTLSLLLLIIISLAILTQAPGEKLLANLLEKQLHNLIHQEVRIGFLETNLISRLQIDDLRILSQNSPDSTDLIFLQHCRVDYQLLPLIFGKFIIESVDLSALDVNIQRDSIGTFNLPQFPTTEEPESPTQPSSIQLELRQLTLSQCYTSFTDETGEIPSVGIHNLRVLSTLNQDSGYQFKVQADTNYITYQDSIIDISELLLVGKYSNSVLVVDTLSCYLPGINLSGVGTAFIDTDDPTFDATLQINGDPAAISDKLSQLLPDAISPVQGGFNLDIGLNGIVSDPRLNIHFISPSMSFGNLKFDSLQIDA